MRLAGTIPAEGAGFAAAGLGWTAAAAAAAFALGCAWIAGIPGRRSGLAAAGADMLAHAPVALFRVAPDGRITAAAGAVADVFETPAGGLAPARLVDLFDGDALAKVEEAAAKARSGGTAIGFRVDGGGRALDLRLTALDGDGVILAARDASVDAAFAQRLEEERDAARKGAVDRTRFFASLTHELRTPLNAVLGFSDAMREKLFGPLPAKYAEYAELINESARHMLDIVGDVIDASRVESGRFELERSDFDAVETLRTAVRLVEANAEKKNITLTFTAAQAEIPVNADGRALRQMLLNLLSNAIKFTPEGGRVDVTAAREGPDLVVDVADTGVGMSAEEVARLGRPFEQTASGRESGERGSGLGLAVVRGLAQLHGGAMEAASTPGEGSRIRIRLPVLPKPQAGGERFDARARMDRVRAVDWSDDKS
jgi:cell cycle sensor histidine kinase DivJ